MTRVFDESIRDNPKDSAMKALRDTVRRTCLLVMTAAVSLAIADDKPAAETTVIDESAARPNILYFYVDDMGWGAIGPNGQAERKVENLPSVLTPNLDRLAKQGVNFTRGYGATVCSPARSSQQTGFHQGHTFGDRNDPDNAKKAMRADDLLMGDALAKAGYATGYWGKWGYGGSKDMAAPTIENVQTLPTSHGYQHVVAELHHVRAHTFWQPTLWTAPAAADAIGGVELKPNSMAKWAGNSAYPDTPAYQNHPDYPKIAYCDDVYAFAALDFVRAQAQNYRATGQPFFALFAAQIPHAPFGEVAELPEWDKAYRNDPHFESLSLQSKQWAAMVTRIDAHFGNILAALEDPNGDGDASDSVADNTLVIFQSDNGGPRHSANKEFDANGGLRGNKGSIFEGGIRIPTIMRWPARITADSSLKRGTSSDMVIDVSDLLPTFCELAGVIAPLGLDGVSIAPTLSGTGHQRGREFLIHEAGGGASIIRGNYKLILGKKACGLYDLQADHAEANNIAADHPELVKELHELALGERVTEPRGFANTYHRWTGKDRAAISDADNWSDFVYANAGITYMTDNGPPRVSWTALMENVSKVDAQAVADADVAFLGLEIRGKSAGQTLTVGDGVTVTGRNEIRVANQGTLSLDGGAVSSLRWVDVLAGGRLEGAGTVDATLYTQGIVSYEAGAKGIAVNGPAHLGGELAVSVIRGKAIPPGTTFTVLKAEELVGSFTNADSVVTADNGARFKIEYAETAVTLTAL
jgi:arylsulfatase A-like enzyme